MLRDALRGDAASVHRVARRDRLRGVGWGSAALVLAWYGQWVGAALFAVASLAWIIATERRNYWAMRLAESRSHE